VSACAGGRRLALIFDGGRLVRFWLLPR